MRWFGSGLENYFKTDTWRPRPRSRPRPRLQKSDSTLEPSRDQDRGLEDYSLQGWWIAPPAI